MSLKYLYVPSGYKAGKAYGVLPNEAAADLAFVRGSSATRINANGLVETMGNNVPRLDYTDGSCPTLLTEPERTNLVAESAEGIYGNPPASETQTLAPDGTNTAVIPTVGDLADRYQYTISAGSATGDTKITYSWYRKRLSTPSEDPNQTGDLKITNLVNCIQDGSTIQIGSDIGGYDRFSATFDVIDGSLEAIIRLYFGEVVGVGNSSVAYFGHQVEVGEYATSYIPTSGATVTRSADTGVISGDLSSYINSSEGVLEIKAKALFNGRPDARIGLSDGTLDNRVTLSWRESANKMSIFMKVNGSNVLDGGAVEFENFYGHDQSEMATFKIKWKSGDIQVKLNGTVVFTDTSSFSGLVLNELSFNRGTLSQVNIFQGNVQYIKVYDSITDF